MELINNKTPPYAQAESSSETQQPTTNARTKSLLLLKNCTNTSTSNSTIFCYHHHHHHQEMVVSYKECLKNHAASMGGHALDGCGEFMPSPSATPTDPASLKCAACGCHRNFHRRDPYDGPAFIHHHHLPPPPQPNPSSSLSPSPSPSTSPSHTPPSPVPYSYYSSAPHMLLALSTGPVDEYHHHHNHNHHHNHSNHMVGSRTDNNNGGRKRSRTKFSKEQKAKMHAFAERLGWRMPKSEEKSIEEFCNEVGVDRGVLKVWMHNNKNTFGKKLEILAVGNLNLENNSSGNDEENGINGNAFNYSNSDIHNNDQGSLQLHVSTNKRSPSAS
ncbi:hypothetical protein PTKIN_Ptkin02bG0014700 [Pterospermum kingtungense]